MRGVTKDFVKFHIIITYKGVMMKKLMIVLSLVFVASCGDDDSSSVACTGTVDKTDATVCAEEGSDKADALTVGTDKQKCTFTDTTDNDKKFTCVEDKPTTTTTVAVATLPACTTTPDSTNTSVCVTEANSATLTAGQSQVKCTQTVSNVLYHCVEAS